MPFLEENRSPQKTDNSKILFNRKNVQNRKMKTMSIGRFNRLTEERKKEAEKRRGKLFEFKKNVFKIKIDRNKIIKYNVG